MRLVDVLHEYSNLDMDSSHSLGMTLSVLSADANVPLLLQRRGKVGLMLRHTRLCHAERSEASIRYGFLTAFGMTLSVLSC